MFYYKHINLRFTYIKKLSQGRAKARAKYS